VRTARSVFIFASLLALVASTTFAEEIRFADVTRKAGLFEPLQGFLGHGAAWGDLDGDGDLDLYVGGFADRPDETYKPAKGPIPNRLFRNRGDGTFEMVQDTPAAIFARTSGAVFADLDNDGDADLYVANNCKGKTGFQAGPQRTAQLCYSKLFRNDGGRLIDVTGAAGACPEGLGTARNIGVFDYDADGRLDLLVVEDRFSRGPRSVLLRNLGKLKFRDANRSAALPDDLFGLGSAVADVNDDGRPDFFIGHSNRFFLSTSDGKYVEPPELKKTFAWEPLHNEDWPCGAALGDLNRDGRLDLVLGIHGEPARNRVYINQGVKQGVPQFRDVTAQVGMPDAVPQKCPHVEIQDFDNDGWPDIYFSAAWLDEQGNVTPLVFRNAGLTNGLPRFTPPKKIAKPMVYYSTGPSGDYDGDGRVDLFLVNWFAGNHSRLLHNESPARHWLDVAVTGRRFNRDGVGSQVRVYRPGQAGKREALLGFQEISIGYGYGAGQAPVCHFGLGDAAEVDVSVRLPDGKTVIRKTIAADQRLLVEEE